MPTDGWVHRRFALARVLFLGTLAIHLVSLPYAHAQPQQAPAFEVASVKKAAPGGSSVPRLGGGPGTESPGRFTATNATLMSLLTNAYGLRPWRLIVPNWLRDDRDDRYDIEAKIPPGATQEQLGLMLQGMLKERFGLVEHREMRELPICRLTVGKDGAKLKEIKVLHAGGLVGQRFSTSGMPKDKDGWPVIPTDAVGTSAARSGQYLRSIFRAQPVSELVKWLEGETHVTVADETGLTGAFDFDLTHSMTANTPQDGAGPGPARDPSDLFLYWAGELDRLGLRLVVTKGPVEVVVVDHFGRVPTEN